jgi:hypothetical protein
VIVSVPEELEFEKMSIRSILTFRQNVKPPGTPAIKTAGDTIADPDSGVGTVTWILLLTRIVSCTTGGSEIREAL